ncbi:MAG: hypothetical protein ISS45_09550 [Candidatus Omnitrophica bacterium]|nr:hypothetical protein [Candidatus Omnitrophota bacterium]
MKDKFSIILLVMGILAILCTLFIWFWLGTVGMFIGMGGMSYSVLWICAVPGLLPAIVGIGVLRRRQWSRLLLMIFWLIVSLSIICLNLLSLKESAENPYWFAEVGPWLFVALIGILHIIFLTRPRVKGMFA